MCQGAVGYAGDPGPDGRPGPPVRLCTLLVVVVGHLFCVLQGLDGEPGLAGHPGEPGPKAIKYKLYS